MQVTRPGGQLWKQCKWRHLMTKCWTNASCATWWPNLQLMQVAPPVEQICNHCKYLHVVANIWKQWMRLHMAKLFSCKWQVAPSSGQICNQFKWFQVMVKFRTDPSGEFWTNTSGAAYNWPNLEPMQVAFYLAGEITQVKRVNTLGPLCLWQCFWYNCIRRCIVSFFLSSNSLSL